MVQRWSFWTEHSFTAPGFSPRISLWNLPRLGRPRGVGKRFIVTPGNLSTVTSSNLLDCRSNFGKRVRLTGKTRPGIPVLGHPESGHVRSPTPRRLKRLHPPDSSGAEVGEPRNLFLRLEVG